MIRSVLLLLVFGSTLSFPFQKAPLLSEELGCSPTLSILSDRDRYEAEGPFVFFDPLGIATDANFPRLREAELKHGRVCMLAVTEIMTVPILKRSDVVVPKNFPETVLAALQTLQWSDYLKVLVTCAILETFVFVQREATAMPGDYGTGYYGVRDKGLHEDELVVELEHGRLSMLAFLGAVTAELITGQSWDQQWLTIFQKWVQQ
jgi:hypothetical protein